MTTDLVATASITIDAPLERVWDELVNPDMIRRYMFGVSVESEWRKGAPIVWKGVWRGQTYEDRGVIVDLEPRRRLRYTHFSPLAGEADLPQNYHQITIELSTRSDRVHLALSHDNNQTEEARLRSERSWNAGLAILKDLIEAESPRVTVQSACRHP